MSDADRRWHETWLGMVQPIEGLVVSLPVLVEANIARRWPPQKQQELLDLAPPVEGDDGARSIPDLPKLLAEHLDLTPDLFDTGDALPEDLSLYVPEGGQTLRPTMALRKQDANTKEEAKSNGDATPATRAGATYVLLLWDLPDGLPLGKSETVTGPWDYPPSAKLDRLLRHCRVPIGVLTNRRELRLVYAPHGESSGAITFRLDDMATVGGRPILDAFLMLLSSHRFFGDAPERQLPQLLARSREHQANVTNELAAQVFEALEILLGGFESAAERDGWTHLQDALEREDDHLYGGLLTLLLRLVFLLYAEDRDLTPESEVYTEHLSILGLFGRLQEDAGAYPDSMSRRYGAWSRLVSLFRAVFNGASHGDLAMPPRRGELFDPHRYAFIEGWEGPTAPIADPEAQAEVRVPSIDDDTVFRVLEKLVVFQGQRLSYRALDVEQIGSVYEGLMGYHVHRLADPAVCMRPNRVWVTAGEVLAEAPARRAKWLQQTTGLAKSQATTLAAAIKDANDDAEAVLQALEDFRFKKTPRAPAGRLVLQPGAERRRTSSHYTPRSLSAPIVARTVEPLLATMAKAGESPSSERILSLKICDPAMGSGAFLVEACRFLADQVVAAWTHEGKDLSAHEDPVMHARRLVAQRCLYGVDKNAFAVSLAKLSLWLVTLAKDLPFTFLDHALRHGDSLVGLSFDQIRAFHWRPKKKAQLDFTSRELDAALSEAISLRQQILELAGNPDPVVQREKERLLGDAEDALDRVRLIGDLVVGAFFSATKDKDREKERVRRSDLVAAWLASDSPPSPELLGLQTDIRARLPVFHWMAEYPEVFYADRPDPLQNDEVNHAAWLDAFVGNPPFAGKNAINDFGGPAYLNWLKTVHEGAHGNADYSAHFFRRADSLLGEHGTVGLIATNTIAQGDTRATGLQALLREGLAIYDAKKSMLWPGEAAVAVSVVHLAKGSTSTNVPDLRLDDVRVESISSRLRPRPERPDPVTLRANAGLSFVGSYVLGMGFTLTPEERDALVAKDPRNAERIFPYLGGEEVNTSPTQSFHRYVISFGQMSLEEASEWPDLLAIVREKVKPERDRNNRAGYRRYWWQFAEKRSELYSAIRPLSRCLVTARVTTNWCPTLQPADRIFAETLCVFAMESLLSYAVLQSRAHARWAYLLSSSMKDDLRYSVADCFETFPFPEADPRVPMPVLEGIGGRLYDARAAFMTSTNQGLTATYNLLKDPSVTDARVVELRRLHEDLDRAVLAAYGWSDIPVPPYADASKEELSAFEDEIIDRLFLLNSQRAEEERLQGPTTKKKRKRS